MIAGYQKKFHFCSVVVICSTLVFLFKLQFITGVLLITPALCQYTLQVEMRPDVTFGDHNDRFDITDIVEEQNQFENYLASNRRHRFKEEREEAKQIPQDSADIEDFPKRLMARRYSDNDFAYHDAMDSSEGGTAGDFEKALDQFQASNGRRRLRNFVKYVKVQPKRRSLRTHAQRRNNNKYSGRIKHDLPMGAYQLSGLMKG